MLCRNHSLLARGRYGGGPMQRSKSTRNPATNPELVKTAPHTTRVGRLDEVAPGRKPILCWKPRASGKAAD